MKLKHIIGIGLTAAVIAITIYKFSSTDAEVKIYNTTDLHSHFTKQLKEHLSQIDHKNSVLLDAGDMLDSQTPDDTQWSTGQKSIGYLEGDVSGHVTETVSKPMEGLSPTAKEVVDAKYDAAVLGNHEFYVEPDSLKKYIDAFRENKLPLLSANTYFTKEYIGGERDMPISEPYIIKKIHNKNKDIKIGIIGVTTNTINEEAFKNGQEKFSKDVYLQNNPQYRGKYYMTDMVEESIRVAKKLKEKENPDMIILVAHSGEKPKKPRHSGNRIQELAKRVPYVDLIIAGHTHEFIDQHEYKGPYGKKVIVTQSGAHSKGLGESSAKFTFKNNKWTLNKLSSKNIKFKADRNDVEYDSFNTESEEGLKKIGFSKVSADEFKTLVKNNKNVQLEFFITSNKKINFPKDKNIISNKEYYYKRDKTYIYYLTTRDYKTAADYTEKYKTD